MKPFTYTRATEPTAAIRFGSGDPSVRYLAGGTNLLDLMKLNVESPNHLVDVTPLPLANIETLKEGKLRIGAMVRNSQVAFNDDVKARYPLLAAAILSGASAQLRNMATVGGNIMQRTRCPYFNDIAFACNKRQSGSGCSAKDGYNRNLAILGTSDFCLATNPSDMNVALSALDAVVQVQGPAGRREIPFSEFHLLPGATPHLETSLRPGELITSVELPKLPSGTRSHYLKVRDRASYEFALVSVAVVLELEDSKIRSARIAMGGVGTKPWRATEAEKILNGSSLDENVFRKAGEAALKNARAYSLNGFKIELAKRTMVRALSEAGEKHS